MLFWFLEFQEKNGYCSIVQQTINLWFMLNYFLDYALNIQVGIVLPLVLKV